MKINRRFLNLVLDNAADGVHSLRRLDPYKHLFYRSTKEAEAMANNKETMMEDLRLPHPVISFAPVPSDIGENGTLDLFALLGPRGSRDGRIVNASMAGETVLYDADEHHFLAMPCLREPKGLHPMCISIAHPVADQDSLFVMDNSPGSAVHRYRFAEGLTTSCFEVLEKNKHGRWEWRLLPPPPFVHQPGFKKCEITSYTTTVDADSCSSIYISFDGGIGTYRFDTVCLDSSEFLLGWREVDEWKHVGEWTLPFGGEALYVPELNLWFGFSPDQPNHLCAADLSAMEDHGGRQPPTLLHVWEDLNPPEEEKWDSLYLKLVHLGDGMFCIAKSFDAAEATGEEFTVFTGLEIVRDDQGSIRMVKHRCTRYIHYDDAIGWVL